MVPSYAQTLLPKAAALNYEERLAPSSDGIRPSREEQMIDRSDRKKVINVIINECKFDATMVAVGELQSAYRKFPRELTFIKMLILLVLRIPFGVYTRKKN